MIYVVSIRYLDCFAVVGDVGRDLAHRDRGEQLLGQATVGEHVGRGDVHGRLHHAHRARRRSRKIAPVGLPEWPG